VGVRRAIRSPRDVLAMARRGGLTYVILDAEHIGSMLHVRKCAAVAEAAGFRVSLGSPPSVGITAAALLQLAGAIPTFACGNETSRLHMREDLFREPLVVTDGMMTLPTGPGLGVEVDREKLERYLATR
jgi:L-alanine-DL-glutamate epimerase-like enolase superfamily enzyme